MNTRELKRMHGLSLVELMVAIAIGALLLGGATTLFVNNRATYEVTNDMARLQENARFAMETMVRDLRMAAYTGCINETAEVNNQTGGTAGELWDPSTFIEGIDADGGAPASWTPSGHSGAASDTDLNVPDFHVDSDAVTVRYLVGTRVDTDANDIPDLEVVNSVYQGQTTIQVDVIGSANFVETMPAALSDCGSADVFLIDNDPSVAGTVEASGLSRAFDPVNRALLSPMTGARYFVRDNPGGVRALYRGVMVPGVGTTPTEQADELVDGVETMQLLYGVDTAPLPIPDGIPDAFVTADAVTNWASVVAIRVSLLMATIDEYGRDPLTGQRFQVADQKFCSADVADADCDVTYPTDRRRRRVYDTTVAVRNLQ